MNKIYVVGMGPGKKEFMTFEAENALNNSDVIIGYTVYLDLLKSSFPDKEYLSTPMRREEERCRMCFEEAMKGKQVSMVCSGDAGVYGMASLMYHIGKDYPQVELEIVPGVTAALSGAAVLGA
ncbi:MAG: precorrin-3B C(17)-methyltransferase, partial [Lachnospiraceae bacterium]|nr:precorrin-3B C(17)-methyltransferase [Lachnospiraceae bacterium]